MELDSFDLAILRLLQDDNRLTSDAIGEQVGLSPTACQRRIKRLRIRPHEQTAGAGPSAVRPAEPVAPLQPEPRAEASAEAQSA